MGNNFYNTILSQPNLREFLKSEKKREEEKMKENTRKRRNAWLLNLTKNSPSMILKRLFA